MAEGKKSFIAYSDWKDIFDELPDEEAGKLVKHIFAYVNDENPETDSILIRAVFAQIKSTLKRDLNKWERQKEQRSKAGKASAEKRKATKSNDRSTTVNERARNSTVSDSVSDTVSDSVLLKKETKEFNIFSFDEFWEKYPKKVAKQKCKAKYNKLTVKDREAIYNTLGKWKHYKPFDGYNHPNPETYLNQKRWEDEIPEEKKIVDPMVEYVKKHIEKYGDS